MDYYSEECPNCGDRLTLCPDDYGTRPTCGLCHWDSLQVGDQDGMTPAALAFLTLCGVAMAAAVAYFGY